MSFSLAYLIERVGGELAIASPEGASRTVSGLQLDSRMITDGDLFAAVSPNSIDAARFAADAQDRGAVAVLTPLEFDRRAVTLPVWLHPDPRRAAGEAAALLQGEPARELRTCAITGTNGKTTTAHLIGQIMRRAKLAPAIIGTTGYQLADGFVEASHTTPDAPRLQALLARHRAAGGRSAVLEVSSHALVQARTAGIHFDVAVFTNLSREHLDYHGDMQRYADAKALLFSQLGPDATAVVNADDPASDIMTQAALGAGARVVTFSSRARADLRAGQLSTDLQGSRFVLEGMGIDASALRSPLRGRYNVENALAAAAASRVLGASPGDVLTGLATTSPAPGRLEPVPTGGRGFSLFVDFAHSPDALQHVLSCLREGLEVESERGKSRGRLILVFGCGGERDAGKRPIMGRVAAEFADVAIVTSDNPRGEDPDQILDEILSGMPSPAARFEHIVEGDRRRAITRALEVARPGDVVLLAGKGHESTQSIGDRVHAFDDRQVAMEVLA
ncbi:MAG: UDP-N-acetylmuramoyl-L-alanyl-D-glutamate--2,6-diaminopimelate ligase [Chlamydiales bacterium]